MVALASPKAAPVEARFDAGGRGEGAFTFSEVARQRRRPYSSPMVAFLNPAIFMPAKRPPVAAGKRFKLVSQYQPAGDQPQAIEALTEGVQQGEREQVLLGVTGSGKTFSVANVIAAKRVKVQAGFTGAPPASILASMPSRLSIPSESVTAFCRRHHIRRLALFGSVLRDDFTAESDVDVLVEFEPGHVPGFRFIALQEELGKILGRRVDLNTPACLSPYFRDRVLEQVEVQFG